MHIHYCSTFFVPFWVLMEGVNSQQGVIKPAMPSFCKRLCIETPSCCSYVYKALDLSCRLTSDMSIQRSISEPARNSLPEVYEASHMTCPNDVKELVKVMPQCRQLCGEPPDVPNAKKATQVHLEGLITTYTCNTDFMPCDNNTVSVCQLSGQWQSVTCEQYRWHNEKGQTKHKPPCGMSKQFTAYILAKPLRKERFSVDILRGLDILLQTDFRLHYGSFVNKIVLSKRFGGHWGSAVVLKCPFKMVVRRQFIIEIIKVPGMYTIIVNGFLLYNFKVSHRLDPTSIDVSADVFIRSFEFRR